MVEQVLRIKADVLADLYEKGALEVQEHLIDLRRGDQLTPAFRALNRRNRYRAR